MAIVDARGEVAAHTGDACMAFAGDAQGDGVSCQANIMANAEVWPAMLQAYTAAQGSLSARLLTALNVAEATGGDLRGRQSAASSSSPPPGTRGRPSCRCGSRTTPTRWLSSRGWPSSTRPTGSRARATSGSAEGRHDEASVLYQRACELAPESDELRFWAGLGAAQVGDMDGALAHVRAAIEVHPGWLELLRRLTPELAPSAPAVLAALDGHPSR